MLSQYDRTCPLSGVDQPGLPDVAHVLSWRDYSEYSDVADTLRDAKQLVSVYEVTGDHDMIAIATFTDTDGMNEQNKKLLNDVNVKETNTHVVLNTVCEHE